MSDPNNTWKQNPESASGSDSDNWDQWSESTQNTWQETTLTQQFPPAAPVDSSYQAQAQPQLYATAPRRSGLTAALLALVVVLLATVGVGVYLLVSQDKTADTAAADAAVAASASEETSQAPAPETTWESAPESSPENSSAAAPETTTVIHTEVHTQTVQMVPTPQAAPTSATCHGQGVLIVESAFSYEDALKAVARHPGSGVIMPGTCPSLRSHYEGKDVYAVVIEYGDNIAALCQAEARGEGNARILNTTTNWDSPC